MNYFAVFIVSAFSIALPAIAAAFRIKRLSGRFIPLAILFWTGLVNETISYLLIKKQHNNSINSNIYTLLEFILLLWFFFLSGDRKPKGYLIAALAASLIWATDIFWLHSFSVHNTLSRIIFSLVIVYLSIDKISEAIFNTPAHQPKAEMFLWFSFFTYYAYQAFISIYEVFPMGISNEFYLRLYLILCIINFIANIIYSYIILWIPKQMEYT